MIKRVCRGGAVLLLLACGCTGAKVGASPAEADSVVPPGKSGDAAGIKPDLGLPDAGLHEDPEHRSPGSGNGSQEPDDPPAGGTDGASGQDEGEQPAVDAETPDAAASSDSAEGEGSPPGGDAVKEDGLSPPSDDPPAPDAGTPGGGTSTGGGGGGGGCAVTGTCAPLEICDKPTDDDGDGLPGCSDPDCDGSPHCQLQTCADYGKCVGESGCGCLSPDQCPAPGTPTFVECQTVCLATPGCATACKQALSPEVKARLSALEACSQANCGGAQPANGTPCVTASCAEEYAACHAVGEESCSFFYFQCAPTCAGPACVEACMAAMSPQGLLDAMAWDTCRSGICQPTLGLGYPACYYLASFFACMSEMGSCSPSGVLQDGASCGQVTDCVLTCSSLEDSACLVTCLGKAGPTSAERVSALFKCATMTCASAGSLTSECIGATFSGACAVPATLCYTSK